MKVLFSLLGFGQCFIQLPTVNVTASPMGKAMFTLIGAMAELESSLIGERVAAGMQAAKSRGKNLGRPSTSKSIVKEIERLSKTTKLSVRQIHQEINHKASRGVVGEIIKNIRQ